MKQHTAATRLLDAAREQGLRGVQFYESRADEEQGWMVMALDGYVTLRKASPLKHHEVMVLYDEARCRSASCHFLPHLSVPSKLPLCICRAATAVCRLQRTPSGQPRLHILEHVQWLATTADPAECTVRCVLWDGRCNALQSLR
jgi:hypothetical protein